MQEPQLIKCIEKMACGAVDNKTLYFARQECLSQIKSLKIIFFCKGFFKINRQFLTNVSTHSFIFDILIIGHHLHSICSNEPIQMIEINIWQPISKSKFPSCISDGIRLVHLHCHFYSSKFIEIIATVKTYRDPLESLCAFTSTSRNSSDLWVHN